MSQKPKDLIPLSEAAVISGKSSRTIKRWISNGFLSRYQLGKGRTAPLSVSKQDLRAYLTTVKPKKSNDIIQMTQVKDDGPSWKEIVEELRNDKSRLLVRVQKLETELVNVRSELAEVREAKNALNKELLNLVQSKSGIVKGLLKGAIKKLTR